MLRLLCSLLLLTLLACLTPVGAAPVDFQVGGVDQVMDLHGDPCNADLVIFAGGNQWMVMPELLAAFTQTHPEVHHIYYETLPPGVLAQQMHAGSLRIGDFLIAARPDVYLAGHRRMAAEVASGTVDAPVTYATNVLALLVRAGNPKGITSLRDLSRSDVRIAMPNPQTEGVARQIETAFRSAGGTELDQTIMVSKHGAGTTVFTSIHHRETPLWLLSDRVDVGPVWLSEALYQERIGSGLQAVRIPAAENAVGSYEGAVVKAAPHRNAAKAFVAFLAGPVAQRIYRSYGFAAPEPTKE